MAWIKNYVRSCDECQHNESLRHVRYGLIQPVQFLLAAWTSISIDFITHLPESQGHTKIMVVVDRFTRMAHFIGWNQNATANRCGRYIPTRSLETWRSTHPNYSRYGRQVFRRILILVMQVAGHKTKDVCWIPPPNRWTDGNNQPNAWRIPTQFRKLQPKRLVSTITTSRTHVE